MSEQKIDGRTREGRARRSQEEAPVQASEAPEAPARARQAREETTRQRRRRRGDISDYRKKLFVNEEQLDRENFEYRFVVDRGNRLHAMTEMDDWDIVRQEDGEVKEDSSDLGASVSVVSGTKTNGDQERMFLCRKPKQWALEDRAEKERRRTSVDQQIKRLAPDSANVSREGGFYSTGQTVIERR